MEEQHGTVWTQKKNIWNKLLGAWSHLTQSLKCINNNFPLITSGDRLFSTPFAFVQYLLALQVLYSRTLLYNPGMKAVMPNGSTYLPRRNLKSWKAISSCKISDTSETIYIIQLVAWIEQMNLSHSLAMTNRYIILFLLMLCMYEFPNLCSSV